MSAPDFPPCPPSLKQTKHYLKAAAEHDARDVAVAYWCRLYALELGLKIDRSSPEAKKFLASLMGWLEEAKIRHKDNDVIIHEIPARAHLENYAWKLFMWADSQDREAKFDRNVVKAFYTAALIYDVLGTFGETTEEIQQNKKYAKWKAAYIHNCLRIGETPVPGPMSADADWVRPSASGPEYPVPGPSPTSPDTGSPLTDYPIISGSGFPKREFPNSSGNRASSEATKPVPKASSDSNTESFDPTEVLNFTKPDVRSQSSGTNIQLSPEQITKAQKYCKWAASALNYEDVPTAISNLEKALMLLTSGVDE